MRGIPAISTTPTFNPFLIDRMNNWSRRTCYKTPRQVCQAADPWLTTTRGGDEAGLSYHFCAPWG